MGYSPKLPRRSWTTEEEAQVRAFAARGARLSVAAAALNRTTKAISERASKLGVTFDTPESRKRRAAGLRRFLDDPEYAEARRERARRGWTPERRAAMSARAKKPDFTARIMAWANSEGNRIHAAAQARKYQEKRLAWCPMERRAEYHRLAKNISAAEARKRIESTMTKFERDLARVRAGAKLEQRVFKPANDYDYSLVGSALA